jgi:hypothetical protein
VHRVKGGYRVVLWDNTAFVGSHACCLPSLWWLVHREGVAVLDTTFVLCVGPVVVGEHMLDAVNLQWQQVHCSKIAEAEAALVCQRKEVVSDAYACAAEARRALGPPNPWLTVT